MLVDWDPVLGDNIPGKIQLVTQVVEPLVKLVARSS